MRIPTEVEEIFTKPNGALGRRVLHSYVVLLTESGGSEVKAIRLDNMAIRKDEIVRKIYKEYPGWNIKGVWRLYEDDFMRNLRKGGDDE